MAKDFAQFNDYAVASGLGAVALFFDGDTDAQSITNKRQVEKEEEPVEPVARGFWIDFPCRHAYGYAENQSAVQSRIHAG